jgi:hypothetical protein
VATGAAAVAAATPAGKALAATSRHSGDNAQTVLTTAVTAEAFAVTFLDEAVKRSGGTPSGKSPLIDVLKAAGAAEYDHLVALRSLGAKPLTTTFYIPDVLFGGGGQALFKVIETAEALFINAYLIGITVFGNAKQGKFARYAGEILGVEAEHRALARFAQNAIGKNTGHVANNRGFEVYHFGQLSQVVGALTAAGVGFGKPTPKGGKAFTLPAGRPSTFSRILANTPDPTGPLV